MALIPKQTKAENKIIFGLTFQRIIGVAFTLIAATQIGSLYVHTSLQLIFTIVCVVFYLIMVTKAPTNPKLHTWKAILNCIQFYMQLQKYKGIIGNAFLEFKESEVRRIVYEESKKKENYKNTETESK